MIKVGQILVVKKAGNRSDGTVQSMHGFRVGEKIEIERITNHVGAIDEAYSARSIQSGSRFTIYRNEVDEGSYDEASLVEHIESLKNKIEDLNNEIAKFEKYKTIMKENNLKEVSEEAIDLATIIESLSDEKNVLKKATMLKEYLSNPGEYLKKQNKKQSKKQKQSKETV